MKFGKKVNFFQAGGAVNNQDPTAVLMEGAALAVQSQDCQMAMQVCQMLLELANAAPAEAPAQNEPVYRKGGRLVRRISK